MKQKIGFSAIVTVTLLLLPVSVRTTASSAWTRLNSPTASGGVIQSIAPSPADPQRLYALMADAYLGQQLIRSDNAAQSWQAVHTFPATDHVTRLAVDPGQPNSVFAGATAGLWRSLDAGLNWTRVYTSGQAVAVISATLAYVGIFASGADAHCASAYIGLSRSTDGGSTWHDIQVGCGVGVDAIAALPSAPNVVFVGGTDHSCGVKCYTWSVIYRSRDGGQTWDNLTASARQVAPAIAPEPAASVTPIGFESLPATASQPAGANGDNGIVALLLDPGQPNRVYGLSGEYFFYSTDGGDTWQGSGPYCFYCRLVQSGQSLFLMRGNIDASLRPYSSEGGSANLPIYRSDDGGAHWWQSLDTYPAYVTAMAPVTGQPGEYYLSLYGRGLWQSHGAGSGFAERNAGVESTLYLTHLYPSPASPATMFVSGGPRPMLERTDDGGTTWTRVLTDVNVTAFAYDPAQPKGAFVATLGQTLEPAYPSIHCALYETADGLTYQDVNWWTRIYTIVPTDDPDLVYAGGSQCGSDVGVLLRRVPVQDWHDWLETDIPQLVSIRQLVPLPGNNSSLLVVATTPSSGPYPILGWLTLDLTGNWSWSPISIAGLSTVPYQISIDPHDPRRIVAAAGNGVYRSTDFGQTWSLLQDPQELGYSYSVVMDELGVPFVSMFYEAGSGIYDGVFTWDFAAKHWMLTGFQGDPVSTMITISQSNRHVLAGTDTGLWQYDLPSIQHSWFPLVGR